MLRPLALAIGICAIVGSAAQGNDSSAELATGGLVLKKNTDIEMRSENLYISPKQIRVKYEFYNPSSKDMRTVVAFPMPDITVTGFHDIAVPTDDPQNILGFSTKIDGKSAPVRVEQKVFADGKELTEVLTRLGVPLAPHLPTTLAALDRLAPEALGELKRLNLVEVEEFDAGKGMEKHASPRWTLKTTYYWDQIFPAKSETTIEHQYIPSVGSSIQAALANTTERRYEPTAGGEDEADASQMRNKYCIDAAFLAAVEKGRKAAKRDYPAFSEERIAYILTTGANWARPIRRFRLVVDKADPSNLVSFCGEGVRKISDTQFELVRNDFTPHAELDVLILKPTNR